MSEIMEKQMRLKYSSNELTEMSLNHKRKVEETAEVMAAANNPDEDRTMVSFEKNCLKSTEGLS